jgi:hypothetical protein
MSNNIIFVLMYRRHRLLDLIYKCYSSVLKMDAAGSFETFVTARLHGVICSDTRWLHSSNSQPIFYPSNDPLTNYFALITLISKLLEALQPTTPHGTLEMCGLRNHAVPSSSLLHIRDTFIILGTGASELPRVLKNIHKPDKQWIIHTLCLSRLLLSTSRYRCTALRNNSGPVVHEPLSVRGLHHVIHHIQLSH